MIHYIFTLIVKIHIYLFYALVISFVLERIGGLYFFTKDFFEKKTDSQAIGSAGVWFIFYLIFGLIICIIDLFFLENGPENVPKWLPSLIFIICYMPLAILNYKFYYTFQGRKKLTPFRKKFNKKYRSIKKKLKK